MAAGCFWQTENGGGRWFVIFRKRNWDSEIVELLLSWLRAVSLLINVCCSRPCLWASDWNYPYPSLKACSTCMTILVTRNRRTCELTSYAESTCSSSDETHRSPREKRQRNTEKTRRNIASFDLSEVLSFTADYWRIYRPMGTVRFGVLLFLIVISQVRFPPVCVMASTHFLWF